MLVKQLKIEIKSSDEYFLNPFSLKYSSDNIKEWTSWIWEAIIPFSKILKSLSINKFLLRWLIIFWTLFSI